MGKKKGLTIVTILILAVSSLIMVKPINSQTIEAIAKPSVPEFTLSFVNSSFTQGVNYVENESIVVSICNQPFTPYLIGVDRVDLSYKIRWKTQLTGDNWTNNSLLWITASNSEADINLVPLLPNATVTDVGIAFSKNNCTGYFGENASRYYLPLPDFPDGGQIDFQVQALIGLESEAIFYGNSSDWSKIQAITVPESSISPNPTPTIPEFPSSTILLLLTVMMGSGLLVYQKKRKRVKLDEYE